MKQRTLAGFEKYGKTTRRAQFLAEMQQVVPWEQLCALIEPVYPKGGGGEGGRPPVPLERMLRIYLLQLWFNLSDPAVEEALYDSAAMRSFAGIDLGREPAPDETTVCKFRHLLEKAKLGEALFKAVNRHLHEQGIKVSRGTIVDASIISAHSSTKNKNAERDPEMHQTAKGKQWFFGMKAHIRVDSKEKILLGDQRAVWIYEGSVSRLGKEPAPATGDLRAGEPLHGSTPVVDRADLTSMTTGWTK